MIDILERLSGEMWQRMLLIGCRYLEGQKEEINALNIFPVPDGDTGTNMALTMTESIAHLPNGDVVQVSAAMAKGALLGARGNSGVILSQLLRGLAKGVEGHPEVDAATWAKAWENGVHGAYQAVIKPVEGTILTVAKALAQGAVNGARKGFAEALEEGWLAGKAALDNTPNQLKVLKEAGVVDAGGMGLLVIWQGWRDAFLRQEEIGFSPEFSRKIPATGDLVANEEPLNLDYPYCTEFVVAGKELPIDELRRYFESLGDCVLVIGESTLVKAHLHTAKPWQALEKAGSLGTLHRISISNMLDQNEKLREASRQPSWLELPFSEGAAASETVEAEVPLAVLAVAAGPGQEGILLAQGANGVVAGGQTQNPSAQDLLRAMDKLKAREVIILPNNKNIILTAQQTASLTDRIIHVVPTRSFPQGLTAALAFDSSHTGEENQRRMTEAARSVKTGEITQAVRDSVVDGREVRKGDYMGLLDGRLTVLGQSLVETVRDLVREGLGDGELVTLFYGSDVSREQAEGLMGQLAEEFTHVEWELQEGGQPLYPVLLAIE